MAFAGGSSDFSCVGPAETRSMLAMELSSQPFQVTLPVLHRPIHLVVGSAGSDQPSDMMGDAPQAFRAARAAPFLHVGSIADVGDIVAIGLLQDFSFK